MVFAQAVAASSSTDLNSAGTKEALFLAALLGAFYFLLQIFNAVLKSIEFFRRKPKLEEEFATKKDLQHHDAELMKLARDIKEAEARWNQSTGALFAKIDNLTSSVNESFNQMFRDVGKLEGGREVAQQIVEAMKK